MERGIYAYDLVAWDGVGYDWDQKTSNYLFIEVATDEQGNPITETEYEPPSSPDLRRCIYKYRLREVPVPLDNDGDIWENEDPEDGMDNDGDELVSW
ncbi:MAG: hypothetical protein NZT92_03020 [Abditibacteriales bacterium]|nr:hypothetical protein [Abditibacteriales bacterium]